MATIVGASGNDTLRGTDEGDRLSGLVGNDVLDGRGGNDELYSGSGADIMTGGAGADTFRYWSDTYSAPASTRSPISARLAATCCGSSVRRPQ